jgi:hypothetical protein
VVATCEIKEGDELCFSYGERSNDDFFVHYGFVPLRNPRDEVILFESIESALDWYVLESGFPVGVRQHDEEELVADMRNIGEPRLRNPQVCIYFTSTPALLVAAAAEEAVAGREEGRK